MATRVIVVRHGESTYNVERRIQGHCDDSVLTPKGRTSAQQVAIALHGLSFSALYTSPLQRAKETAELIRANLAPTADLPALIPSDQLKEISLPLWEGMLFDDVRNQYPEQYRCWNECPHQLRMEVPGPQGSQAFYPLAELYARAGQFWQDLLPQHPNGTVLLVAHSGITRALISTALGLAPELYQYLQVSNCGINILNFADADLKTVQLEAFNLTDHLGEAMPKFKSNHRGPRLLLVRHGETNWNRDRRFQGQIDVPLNTTGADQARQVAEFLQTVPLSFAASSPLARPKATAEAILHYHKQISLSIYDDLKEISHGLWEGKLDSEVEAEYPGLLQQWKTRPETVQMPGGENLQQVWERAIGTWQAIVEAAAASPEPKIALVSAHDAINKAILCHLFGLGPDGFWIFKQGNGAVSVIDYPNGPQGHPVLQAINITTHLGGGVLDKTAAGAL